MDLTFEKLPEAVNQLYEKLNNIERILLSIPANYSKDTDELLTVSQAAEFLTLSVPTIYGLVSQSKLPVNKQGKRLYFSKNELIQWIKAGRKKTISELETQADVYLQKKKRGKL